MFYAYLRTLLSFYFGQLMEISIIMIKKKILPQEENYILIAAT